MADIKEVKDALIEKIRGLLGDEAATVAKQHIETSTALDQAKQELADIEEKKRQATSEAEGQVTGLTTRLAEVEKREADLGMREQLVQTGEATQEQTGKNLALREQALVPQEQEYRQHLLDLSTKESEIIKDATELSALRNELLKNAEDQKTKQATLNALKDSLKQIQTDLLKKETDLTGKS